MQPPIQQNPSYQPDETQEEIIELYQSNKAPKTLLTLASPGTGKTTTISRIIQKIIDAKNYSTNFIVLTFTRKTRFDLISKLKALPAKYQIKKYVRSRIKNFHSFAYDILHWKEIIDENTEMKTVNDIIAKFKLGSKDEKHFTDEALRVKDKLLAQGKTDQQWSQLISELKKNKKNRLIAIFLSEYKSWLQRQFQQKRVVTFDSSLIKTVQQLNNKCAHSSIDLDNLQLLIVDEFQDSNPAQIKIVDSLLRRSKKDTKLLMVGDFDQNIYTWRGSDIQYIDQFLRARKYQIKYLGNSYRLGQSLKDLSQQLIKSFQPYEFFRKRFYRNYSLKAKGKHNEPTEVRTFEYELTQVKWTIDKIYEHMNNGIPLGEMTILVRSTKPNFTKKIIQQIKFRKEQGFKQIYYQIQLYNNVLKSATIKYLLSIFSYFYKKSIKHTDNQEEIRRITSFIDFVGQKDLVRNKMIEEHTITKQLLNYQRKQNYHENRKSNWRLFFQDWERIEDIMKQSKQFGFVQAFRNILDVLRLVKWGNVRLQFDKIYQFYELVDDIIDSMSQTILDAQPVFSVFQEINRLASKQDHNQEEQYQGSEMMVSKRKNRLQIQTIHTSKGLEFQVVFLCSLNYQFPYFNKKNPFTIQLENEQFDYLAWTIQQKQKQELRITYTALTRSSRYSYVSSSLKFDMPDWLRNMKPKENAHFKFIRQNGKFMGKIPITYESIYSEKEQEEILIKMMEKHSIN